MMVPAHNPGILSLDELVAWLRNSSLRRIQKVGTHLSKTSPITTWCSASNSPSKGTPLSGQTSRNSMPIDEAANACLRGFSSPLRTLQDSPHYISGCEENKPESWPVSAAWVRKNPRQSESHLKTLKAFRQWASHLSSTF